MRMNFLGMLPFTAPYLPWVLLVFSILIGSPPQSEMVRRQSTDTCPKPC